VFSMEVLSMPETAEACEISADASTNTSAGVTGLNCAGFGSSIVVTASFGLMAAAQVLRKLAAPVPLYQAE
jgi:tRNA A37 threonylcarbamoyladenosine dehydratase